MNAMPLHRLGNWFHRRNMRIASKLCSHFIRLTNGSVVPSSCEIGPGTQFAYGGIGVVLHEQSRIGSAVMIGPQTTIGGNFGTGVPIVGDNVYLAPGARILGGITVGSNVLIGANAVVVRDVPDNCIVGGIPARVIRNIPAGALHAIHGTLVRDDMTVQASSEGVLAERR
jgi:serine O-acetyltransferase